MEASRPLRSASVDLINFLLGETTVSNQATHDQHVTDHVSTEGGRACPPPVGLIAPCGAGRKRRQRALGSTGVITADLFGRSFS